jgi:hypothetical protein
MSTSINIFSLTLTYGQLGVLVLYILAYALAFQESTFLEKRCRLLNKEKPINKLMLLRLYEWMFFIFMFKVIAIQNDQPWYWYIVILLIIYWVSFLLDLLYTIVMRTIIGRDYIGLTNAISNAQDEKIYYRPIIDSLIYFILGVISHLLL